MEERKTPEYPSRLLVSFVADNSPSVSRERLAALMSGLRRFSAAHAEDGALEWELICYDGFTPTVAKSFEDADISPVYAGRMPLFGRACRTAADRLLARAEALRAKGHTVPRPWLFLLSDGFTLDETEEVAAMLDTLEHEGALMYLPFRLSPTLTHERMQAFDRIKHMIEVKEGSTDGLLAFVEEMLTRRMALPADEPMQFQKTDFEGWALL